MMDKEAILRQETDNDGQSVFLYYDPMAGLYLAFGLSAYYVTMVTNPYMSSSDELGMPVALLRKDHILALRQGLKKVEHERKKYYHFQMKCPVGDAGYSRWKQSIEAKHIGT